MLAGIDRSRSASASVEREQAEPEQPIKGNNTALQKTGIKVKFKRLKKE